MHEASTIPFLCTGNYYRSRFAEEMFNREARIAGLNWRASSRGLAPEPSHENVGAISLFALQALNDRSISPAERFPVVCTIDDLEAADRVIALKEAEHRLLLANRFPGWENCNDLLACPRHQRGRAGRYDRQDRLLVLELIKDCQSDHR